MTNLELTMIWGMLASIDASLKGNERLALLAGIVGTLAYIIGIATP